MLVGCLHKIEVHSFYHVQGVPPLQQQALPAVCKTDPHRGQDLASSNHLYVYW